MLLLNSLDAAFVEGLLATKPNVPLLHARSLEEPNGKFRGLKGYMV